MSQEFTVQFNAWRCDCGTVKCFKSENQTCFAARLRDAERSRFHTEWLQRATEQINAILEQVEREDPDRPEREVLSILATPDGLFLAWTEPSNEVVEIRRSLGIRL